MHARLVATSTLTSLANLLSDSGAGAAALLQKTQDSFSEIVSNLHAPQRPTGAASDEAVSQQHPALCAYREGAAA